MANPISLAILNLLGGAGNAYNQGISRGREQELGLQEKLIGIREGRVSREFQAGEAEKGRTFQAGQAGEERKFQGEQTEKGQIFQKGLQEDTQAFQAGEGALNRAEQEKLQGMESSTSLRVARIHEGIDTGDPTALAKKEYLEVKKFYREHPEFISLIPKGGTVETEALQAYRSAVDMAAGKGIFDPNFGRASDTPDYPSPIGPGEPGLSALLGLGTEQEFSYGLGRLFSRQPDYSKGYGYKHENYFPPRRKKSEADTTRTEP